MKREELYHLLIDMTRNAEVGEVITRAAAIVPASLSEANRNVRCTLTTEDAVAVFDWQSGRVVLETLIVSGATFDDQTPLLRDHNHYNVDAILGSITEVKAVNDTLDGLLTFGEDLDPDAEKIWRRVKQGHLRRVSVGYEYSRADYVTIPAGETQTVQGRSFTAPKERDLRVVFRWFLREVSVVVIPADKRAQMRAALDNPVQRGTQSGTNPESSPSGQLGQPSQSVVDTRSENPAVNELLNFLRQHGLAADVQLADEAAALGWARQHLAAERHADLLALCSRLSIAVDTAQFPGVVRTTPTTSTPPAAPIVPAGATVDPAIAERQRQSAIRSLAAEHPSVPQSVVTACLDNGDTLDAARSAFLTALRGSRQEPVNGNPPAGHIRGGMTLAVLQAGLLMKFGFNPESTVLRSNAADSVISRRGMNLGWLRGVNRQGEARNEVEAAFDYARSHQLQHGSMMRFAEAMLALEGPVSGWNQDETLERAFSSGNFTSLFGSVVHMMMIAGYQSQPSTYQQIARVIDVPDFRENKEAMSGGVGRLKKQGKNGEKAALLNIDSPTIASVAAERYAGLLKLTDQVFIQDSFGALNMLPGEVGASAGAIPNDLLYSIVLGNATMSDSQALYIDGTNLIVDGSLDEDGLNVAGILLKNKLVNGKRIVVTNGVLLHGTTLSTKAKKVLNNTTTNGDENVMRNTFRRLEDNVVDLGCTNPATDPETTIAGTPNSYYLFAEPLRSLVVAFRQGTNRGPVTRATRLSEGEWGYAWDVFIDCGATAQSRIGTVRVNQA